MNRKQDSKDLPWTDRLRRVVTSVADDGANARRTEASGQ